jgi:threonine dehydratase
VISDPVTLKDIQAAGERIRPYAHRTPVLTCRAIDEAVGAECFFKCENFQKVGAFKFRGACNTVFSLGEAEAKRGVVTHSSGNHAAAVSLAARLRGVPARIVMPENAPRVKVEAVRGYGGEITFCDPDPRTRDRLAGRIAEETGATLVHPFNDPRIIAGQGTAALEFFEDIESLDAVLTPLGGGGLLSGTAIVSKACCPETLVVGAEPENADDAYRSKAAGRIIPAENPQTVADGLRTSLGSWTFPVIRDLVDSIALASEAAILRAMRMIFERMKIIVEPSAAVVLAVLLENDLGIRGKRIGLIPSGGNVDFSRFFEDYAGG